MPSRNIFITGGMGGIGKSCVQKFVDQGNKVVFTYAGEKSNQIVAEEYAASVGNFATALIQFEVYGSTFEASYLGINSVDQNLFSLSALLTKMCEAV